MDNTRRLDIPGARGTVEVEGVLGLLYKVRIGGEIVKRSKSRWSIPLRNGSTAKLSSNGIIPGFQTLYLDGTPVLKMGAHVPTAAKVAMFAPLLLIVFGYLGPFLAVFMFLTNVLLVKNPQVPVGFRVAMPIVTTAIMALLLTVIGLTW
ncbi:hypothetical protein [Demequina soli]|uniref:hypothetical protein n=1 Tax=Demequina soli TaxID=1638987 RepID=UPI00078143B0|nr:hypothetical protein [Demequina soli]